MNEEIEGGQRKRRWIWTALAALAVLLALLIIPPMVSVSRYKAQITRLISASLGRPVRMSSVEVRLLPRPGFVLTDFTVAEDPAYGAEPVLHANTVIADIRLLSLWRGRLAIDTISVDEASLNVVRTPDGRWNLDSLLRTATHHTQHAPDGSASEPPFRLPYLEATNSRINIKNGVEKLPFSLTNADVSMWQPSPGEWRVRLRGQPVRTDMSLAQAETGVVRLEAELHQAPELRQMPVRLDLEWSQAQLGQLTRLLLGNDAGWRGDLTGDFHLNGTAETASITTRLRAVGVHREEFTPSDPMDFDANCSMTAHFSARAIDNLTCDSPVGDGHIHLTGTLPGTRTETAPGPVSGLDSLPRYSVVLDHIAVSVALDALRTVRSGLAPGLEASGSASGTLDYAPAAPDRPAPHKPSPYARRAPVAVPASPQAASREALTGSIAITGFQLSGNGLDQPISIPRLLLTPAPVSGDFGSGPDSSTDSGTAANLPLALTATAALPAGAPTPLMVSARLAFSGYQVTLRGPASIVRARQLAQTAGITDSTLLDSLAGEPISMDLTASGPWIASPASTSSLLALPATETGPALLQLPATNTADSLTGTVTLRNANWKADYLANHVLIAQATLHLGASQMSWDPVAFSYGPLKGSATLAIPTACVAPRDCTPAFQLQFGALDARVLQAAILGAQQRTTLLTALLDRFHSSSAPPWPQMKGTIKAASLRLGPVTLTQPTVAVSTLADGAEITAFDAGLLGGHVYGTGALHSAATAQSKPSYEFSGQFEKLRPAELGQLLRLRCSGGVLNGSGKVTLAGFTADDLAASATGTLHFNWRQGSITGAVPAALSRFQSWSADAIIAHGALTLSTDPRLNQLQRGNHAQSVPAAVPFAEPLKVEFTAPKSTPKSSPANRQFSNR